MNILRSMARTLPVWLLLIPTGISPWNLLSASQAALDKPRPLQREQIEKPAPRPRPKPAPAQPTPPKPTVEESEPPQTQPAQNDQARREKPDPRQVELAIAGGLRWLAQNQIKEGSEAGSWESTHYPTAITALAGLAFLANGHMPGQGEYGQAVDRAMKYVQASMTGDGYLGNRGNSMYVHAICTLFGLSYLGMNPDPAKDQELAQWCQKSLNLIVAAQQVPKPRVEQGGWRYQPFGVESDLSVTSWQLLVLHAARQCGFQVDQAVIDQGMRYVNSGYVLTPEGETGFIYRPGVSKSPEPGATGSSIFLKSIFEADPDHKQIQGLRYLQQFSPSWGGPLYRGYFYFGAFYITQGMVQIDQPMSEQYLPAIQRVLIDHQEGDGRWPYPPDDRTQSVMAGPVCPTAMAVLILSLDKQYLPMYQRQRAFFR